MSGIDLSTLNESQRRIATTLDRPLFVEAGAGSGKTFTLTRRVAWALSPGSGVDGQPFLDDLSQVLVITFTDAAAREIKERVRSTLRAAGMRDAALAVDSAWISTIHGMCRRILKRHALDLGIDPNFDVCSSHVERELLDMAVEQTVGIARRNARPGTLEWQAFEEFEYNGVVSRVSRLVGAAHACVNGFDDVDLRTSNTIAEQMQSLLRAYEALGLAKLSEAAKKVVLPALDALRDFAALPPSERSASAASCVVGALKVPRASKAIKELVDEARTELNLAKALAGLERVGEFAPLLLGLARSTDDRYDAIKRSRAMLDNDDLITLALAAVKGEPAIARRYAGRFRLVMVDEFQDTDPKQLELISALAGGDVHASVEPRHLATVGDAQQSIYRFRGADVNVFVGRGERVDSADHVRLDVNYRSHRDVLALVDAVCGGSHGVLRGFMHLDDYPEREDGYAATTMPRIHVEVASGSSSQRGVSALRCEQLAAQVADRLVEYRDAGQRAGDMALLLGATTHAASYIDALRERGLECVVTGGSTFTRAPEVAVMLSLLRTLANPRDTQSGLFPVLSSEMFELDANDFLQLGSRAQVKLDAPTKRSIDRGLETMEFFGGAKPSKRLQHAHGVLAKAWGEVATRPVADICLDVVRDSGWLSRLEAQGAEGIAREANVLAAIRYIRDLTEELGLGPVRAAREFALWLEESKIPPASLAGAERDTVRIMTIHASKGLEYPIVAVAECWEDPRAESGVYTARQLDGTMRAAIVPKGGAGIDGLEDVARSGDLVSIVADLRASNADADAQEKARLLYVALTRAREALVLAVNVSVSKSGISSKLAAGVVGALFGGDLPPEGVSTLDYGGSASAVVRHVVVGQDVAAQDAKDEDELRLAPRPVALYPCESVFDPDVAFERAREDVFSYSSALADKTVGFQGASQGTTSVSSGSLPTRQERDAEAAGEPADGDADKATDLGSCFHMLAQVIVETGRELDSDRVEAMVRRYRLSARQRARLDAALACWISSELRAEALGWAMVRAEVPFFVPVDQSPYGRYVEGAIDLLCTEGAACEGPALVVDYKTGDVGLSEAEVRARHAAQAELYGRTLLSLGFSSVECAFICVETGMVVRYQMG